MLEEGLASSVNDALDQPIFLIEAILDARAFARAREHVRQAKSEEELNFRDPYVAAAWDLFEEQALERRAVAGAEPDEGSVLPRGLRAALAEAG